MFAEYSKKEFIQTALGATSFIVVGYLTMLGLMVMIA